MTRDQIQLHPGLFQAILDNPADDLRRLVYADWLDDQGEHQRAEFIRVQVELASLMGSRCTMRTSGKSFFCRRSRGVWQIWTMGDHPFNVGDRVNILNACKGTDFLNVKVVEIFCRAGGSAQETVFYVQEDAWMQKSKRSPVLRHRERELLELYDCDWIPRVEGLATFKNKGQIGWLLKRSGEPGYDFPIVFSRGFISTVRLPLEAWIGQECDRCRGLQRVGDSAFGWRSCPDCHGLGRIGAHGPRLVAAAPLERVEVSDRKPHGPLPPEYGPLGNGWFWLRRDFPLCLWPLLQPDRGMIGTEYYDSRDGAITALSEALLAWASK